MASKTPHQNKRSGAPARDAKGRLLPGQTANPGGRPKKLREIEAMLDKEHRDPAKMREVFDRLRALAMGEAVTVPVPGGDGETMVEIQADAHFMKLYLERVMGPVKDLEVDMSDWPDEVVKWWAEYRN